MRRRRRKTMWGDTVPPSSPEELAQAMFAYDPSKKKRPDGMDSTSMTEPKGQRQLRTRPRHRRKGGSDQ